MLKKIFTIIKVFIVVAVTGHFAGLRVYIHKVCGGGCTPSEQGGPTICYAAMPCDEINYALIGIYFLISLGIVFIVIPMIQLIIKNLHD